MIGVIANPSDHPVVKEFFELFKTPWELYEDGRQYDVVLCAGHLNYESPVAKVVLVYSSETGNCDAFHNFECAGRYGNRLLSYRGEKLPIYGQCLTFKRGSETACLFDEASEASALSSRSLPNGSILRIGYDLFFEIRTLLTAGQPVEFARIPTLDMHIAVLREMIVSAGVTLIEIPPVPEGCQFIACLTHDVDHASVRSHKLDHTIAGFIYRAVLVSLKNLLCGSIPLRDCLTNWAAALRLPLVYLGLADDFWQDFACRYRHLEQEISSTYFIIPVRDYPGRKDNGKAPAYRAVSYCADDVASSIAEITATGSEVGLHGIDAWLDSSSAVRELRTIQRQSGAAKIGSRMHWLYFSEEAPRVLEQAGAAYDSTVGYRETVGFHAGTAQAYKPLSAEQLLEVPLHVMDTALFYPGYLGLSSTQATRVLGELADIVERFGGCLTVNWHDRSLAPERLWYASYSQLLDDLKARGVWFATASQAVAWFRKRRSVVFGDSGDGQTSAASDYASDNSNVVPGLRLRIHQESLSQRRADRQSFIDVSFSQDALAEAVSRCG